MWSGGNRTLPIKKDEGILLETAEKDDLDILIGEIGDCVWPWRGQL